MGSTLLDILKECCVRVVAESRGTGFFVAPGIVVTCAHVVGVRAERGSAVRLERDDEVDPGASVEEIWPDEDEDLALLRTSLGTRRIAVLGTGVRLDDKLLLRGFPDYGSGAQPDELTVTYDGRTHSPGARDNFFLKFKANNIIGGLSGGPLLNLRTAEVIGVVTETRGKNTTAGGWAVPVTLLLKRAPWLAEANARAHRKDNEWRRTRDEELREREEYEVPVVPRGQMIKRARFLKDVDDDVTGRLEASIHRVALGVEDGPIELGVRPAPEAIWTWVYKDMTSPREYQTVGEAFEFFARRMLLLGEPGSGKSTSLLFLAQKLLAEARSDANSPVPLLVNLSQFHFEPPRSSWLGRPGGRPNGPTETRDRQFENWLIRTLAERAGVTRDVAKRWMTAGQIAFFLDGLDEVHESYRAKLASHFNEAFLPEHPDAAVVVCCRVNEYLPLQDSESTRARLRGGVVLQPLSPAQVDGYLQAAKATGLREALPGDAALWEMAQTPLILSMMTLAYGGLDASNIPRGLPLAGRRHQLMDAYVAKMLQRKERRDKYSDRPFDDDSKLKFPEGEYRYDPTRAKRYLGWLAVRLSARMQNAFSPEHFFDLLSEEVGRDFRVSVRFGLAIARALLGLFGICLLAVFLVPRTLDSVRYACVTGLAFIVVAVMVSDRYSRPEYARTLNGGILGLTAELVAWAMGFLAFGVFARALDITIPGPSNPYAIGITLTLFVAAGSAARVYDKESKRWTLALLVLMLASVPVGVVSARSFLPLEAREAVPAIMASAIGVWLLTRKVFEGESPWFDILTYEQFTFLYAFLCLAIWVVTVDWRWTFAALAAGALGALFIRHRSPATFYSVLLASAAGHYSAGLAGSILGGGVLLLIVFAISRWTEFHQSIENIYEWFENSIEPAIHGPSERQLLSPVATKAVALTGEIPFGFRTFLDYATDALLLKRSAGKVEFMHRILRDYFAMRELLPGLNSASVGRRLEVTRSLGYQGESALPWLADFLRDPDPLIREAAASAVGSIASSDSPALIEVALSDPVAAVRKAGVLNLLNLRRQDQERLSLLMIEERDPEVLWALLEVIVDSRMHGHVNKDLLTKLFTNFPETPELAKKIAESISDLCSYYRDVEWLSPPWTGRFLPDLLRDSQSTTRVGALKCTRLIGQRTMAPIVAELLTSDRHYEVRVEAAKTLGSLGGDQAIVSLSRALSDRDDYVRGCAVDALGHLAGGRVVEPLARALADRDEYVRQRAFIALRDLDGDEVEEHLIRALSDCRSRVREGAARVLAWRCGEWSFGKTMLDYVMSDRGKHFRDDKRLVSMYGAGAVGLLIQALSNREEHVRVSAAKSLGRLGSAGEAESSFNSRSPDVAAARANVAEILRRLGGGPATTALIRSLSDRRAPVRASAAEALGQLGAVVAVDPLIRALSDRKVDVRARAAEALGRLGEIRAKEPLARAMRDRSEIVRLHASKALGQFRVAEPVGEVREAKEGFFQRWKKRLLG
jgi:HEAT repeat protein/MFS family permease